ncbi:SRPBCC domain-containing protein, partial [Streptomyces griseorubiginosus]|uniref:SRPBCC domain-containing protein n=1 Tax=Streptomyces griseorubiginosus TaxID=67304 RepID=UPI001AD7A724
MEHDVFVPVPALRLREALADPARVARAVPGLQQDAGAEPVSGRLKVRVGSHSVTYRGTLRVTARDDGSYAVEGDATETRGTGSVKLALTLRVTAAEGGSTLVFEGTASADGRVTELPADAVGSAVTRLLNRFAENLAATEEPEGSEQPEPPATQRPQAAVTDDHETTPDADDEPAPGLASVFDTEVPPPSLDPVAEDAEDAEDAADTEEAEDAEDAEDEAAGVPEGFAEPPAEAAHARRTMIGRSAEEVDHAPPRGRYAPVP